ncbi:hypothetical protein HT136_19780 [Novosphingobium profundi]|uniref:hypothetical protein n=1 Tax=Novosphingobium profundi TaxID=1774954 RepID=UPI001BDB5C52|nr:hypothetical protein [Novosphingobium profundi]MBT0670612.1 hypothetical protein [Novosphingobium profundi]
MDKGSGGLKNRIVGKAKRLIGEMSARPDLVIKGEKQQTHGIRQGKALRGADSSAPERTEPPASRGDG